MKFTRRERIGDWEIEYTVETVTDLQANEIMQLLQLLDEHVVGFRRTYTESP